MPSVETGPTTQQPPQARDYEVITLKGVPVTLPTEPMLINGQEYEFACNSALMKNALWYTKGRSKLQGEEEVGFVTVRLDDRLPAGLTGQPETDILPYHQKTHAINILVPKAITNDTFSNDEIVKMVETSMSTTLREGLQQNINYRNLQRREAAEWIGFCALGSQIFELAVLSTHTEHLTNVAKVLEYGGSGAALGAGVVVSILGLRNLIAVGREGEKAHGHYVTQRDVWSRKALEQARKYPDEDLVDRLRTPIITLVERTEEEPVQAAA